MCRFHIVLSFVLFLIFCSCSVQKRLYVSGYHMDWKGGSGSWVKNAKNHLDKSPKDSIRFVFNDSDLKLSKRESNSLQNGSASVSAPEAEKYKEVLLNNDVISDSCDVLVMKSGEVVYVQVEKVDPFYVTYRKCDSVDKKNYMVKRDDVFTIKYHTVSENVVKPVEKPAFKPSETGDKKYKEKEVVLWGVFGAALSIIAWFVFGLPFGILAMVFGIAGLITIESNPDIYEGRGYAFFSFIMGLIDVLLVLSALNK